MSSFTEALPTVAPVYNLLFAILTIIFFIILFKTNKIFKTPWMLMFSAVILFIIAEVITLLRAENIINIPVHINGFFEFAIILLFIYALLVQKEKV